MNKDAISIVEAAYDLEADNQSWLSRLVEHAAPRLDRGCGVMALLVDPQPRVDPAAVVRWRVDEQVFQAALAMEHAEPEFARHAYRPAGPLVTASQNIGLTEEQAAVFPPYVKVAHPAGLRDCLGALATDPGGQTVALCAPMPDLRRPSPAEVAVWGRILAHVGAGARLRRLLAGPQAGDAREGEAVLSPSGDVKHAKEGARSSAARESLRAAAKAVDRARTRARRDEDSALDLWKGLVAGRWSLVDQFESDGRRFLVAHRNDPQVSDPRALTMRERQILAYAAMGYPLKLIAYTLGLSAGTVSVLRARGMRKLGIRSVVQLAELFSRAEAGSGLPDHERDGGDEGQ